MIDKLAKLEPESTYHVYNRANGSELLFKSDDNYRFFLRKYENYILPIADTFCYCLMPNHFHFLIRIKKENELKAFFKAKAADPTGFENHAGKNVQDFGNLERLISQQFSNFFNSYAKAFNKQQSRKGNLFMHTFKRKLL